jgi:K+:H+ antiporter
MHGLDLILTLTSGLVAALIGGFVTQRLRLSPIVGYLMAGILVGPYTPGFVADRALAEQLGVLTIEATNTLVGAAIVSITLNPLLFRAVGPVERWAARRKPVRPQPEPDPAQPSAAHRAVIVGYGPVGRTVTRLLQENEIAPTLIEMNVDTVRELRASGLHAVHGDATHPDVLAAAGIASARGFIVSVTGLEGLKDTFRIARQQNPGVQILARATHLSEVPVLRGAGADTIVSEEGEVALAFTTAVLENLGATPDQIDRERIRVRSELIT